MSDLMWLFPRERELVLLVGLLFGAALGGLVMAYIDRITDDFIWSRPFAQMKPLDKAVR